MKLKHTGGKWYVNRAVFGDSGVFTDAADVFPNMICSIKKTEDDAALISAAPEMLDALILAHIALEYVSEYDIPLCTKEAVVKAIESATGKKIEEVIDND